MRLKVGVWLLVSIALSIFSSVPAWADLSKTEVSQLYVSIFGRASEGEGNAFWQSQPDMAAAASAMLDTDAAKDYFGANLNTNQAFIEHIYLNTLDKTLSDDLDGISYWVNMLDTGISRGEAVAFLVKAINDYAPDGPYYDPDDSTTVAAYNQFTNRVEVSDYMADNVWDTPEDWETSTSFSHGLVVSDDPETVYAAMAVVNSFIEGDQEKNDSISYPIVGTNQTKYYNNEGEITAPAPWQAYYGQAAFHPGNIPGYTDNEDGTITDNVTGLMWVKARGSKTTWSDAVAGASTDTTAGYSDWRMPTIKELYSLILFSGVNGPDNTKIDGYIPYIDNSYFEFVYGSGSSTNIGDRIVDCQDWSATKYVSTVMEDQSAVFGVNFADGRIKGYNQFIPLSGAGNENYVRYVRGNPDYGENNFKDNGDNTVTDLATNLMWSKDDSQIGLDWPDALAWVQSQNAAYYLNYNDWRLPDAKELQSIVDYTRSPSTTDSPAIDVNFFNTTSIINEAGQDDYPYFWTGSVLLDGGSSPSGIYISFGRAMGYMNNSWIDVHGAGSQKSDVMVGDPTDYPEGRGPQGDAVRIYNYVRLVRDID